MWEAVPRARGEGRAEAELNDDVNAGTDQAGDQVVELRSKPSVATGLMIDLLRLRPGRMFCVPCVAALAGLSERQARAASLGVRSCARCGKTRLVLVSETASSAPVKKRQRVKGVT